MIESSAPRSIDNVRRRALVVLALLAASCTGTGAPVPEEQPEKPPRKQLAPVDADRPSRAGEEFLRALTDGEWGWIASRATPDLRRTLARRLPRTHGLLLSLRHLRVVRITAVSRFGRRETITFELGSKMLESDTQLTLQLTLEDGSYADYEFGGESWAGVVEAFAGRRERSEYRVAWLQTKQDGVLPDEVAYGTTKVIARFVLAAPYLKPFDGRVRYVYAVFRNAEQLERVDLGSLVSEVPGPLTIDVELANLQPGSYEVRMYAKEIHGCTGAGWTQFLRVLPP